MKIVFVLANNSTAPYFLWFAKESYNHPELEFSFVAMTNTKPILPKQVSKYGCKGYWIKYNSSKRRLQMIISVWRLFWLYKRIKPDVIHTHLFDDSLPGLVAARLARVKVRAITKGDTAYHYNNTPQWVRFDKLNNRNASVVITPTEESFEFVKKIERCPINKLKMIHTSIPVDYFGKPDFNEMGRIKEKYIPSGKFIIGTMARFIEWKGYKTVIKIVELLVEKYPEMVFLLMGEGDEKKEIELMVKEKKLENNVIFGGRIENHLLPSFYPCLDVFLHAAYMEPGGFVIMEAMAAGLPVVSMPTGSARDGIIHKKNGWLGEYNNPKSLADGIEYFYENKQEKPWVEAQNAVKKNFDFKQMFDNYIKIYKSLI